jgi:hypothetical protein
MSGHDDNLGPTVAIYTGALIGSVFLIGLLAWCTHACSIADQATLGRAEQSVQRQNFEESESYRAGLRRDFDELLLSYSSAKTEEEKTIIISTIRHRALGAPPDAVPQDIKTFLAKQTGSVL